MSDVIWQGKDSGNSARGRISAPSSDITPKLGVYPHQVRM